MLVLFLCLITLISPCCQAEIDLKSYYLPEDHPVKSVLDVLFKRNHPLLCLAAFESAGFKTYPRRKTSQTLCAKHPRLKGFLIKTFLDDQTEVTEEWIHWIRRIEGARQLRAWIESHGYEHFFKAPQKWIYAVPLDPHFPKHPHFQTKRFLLVVEDMKILNSKENKKAWRTQVTEAHLNALYFALTENLLIDSLYIDNIPFSRDGRIAFVDTEHYNVKHISLLLSRLLPALSPPMANHWRALIPNFTQPVGTP